LILATSEPVLILAIGTAVLAILFGARLATRSLAAGRAVTSSAAAESPDVAGVVAQPPFIFLGFLAAAAVLEAIIPLPVAASYPTPRYVAGALLIVVAFAIVFAAAGRFRSAGTNIPPSLPTIALVTDGIYARTRNPLYLGSTLIYGGLAVAAGSLWTIIVMVPMLWVINVGVIAREERYLERKFGDVYRAYKGRVRRWV
jgi:protein-S-isoprenylcysteine O-methyltransferase Ste14